MMTDPIADMLTRIRNAVQGRHPRVDVPPGFPERIGVVEQRAQGVDNFGCGPANQR